jgi:hypothetical protein
MVYKIKAALGLVAVVTKSFKDNRGSRVGAKKGNLVGNVIKIQRS